MADPRLFRLRVTFRETGRLALLSHLEVARALERAVRRAKLPYAISQGFSPHMRIAFGAALPVGVGGTAEFFDLFLTDYVASKKALEDLQQASPADLYPTAAEYIEPRAAAASLACPVSTYEVVLSETPSQIVVPEAITVVRKKKEKILDVADFLVGSVELVELGKTVEGEQEATGGNQKASEVDQKAAEGDQVELPRLGKAVESGQVELPVEGAGATVRFTLEAKPTGSLRADAFVRELIAATVVAGHASESLHPVSFMRIGQRPAGELQQ